MIRNLQSCAITAGVRAAGAAKTLAAVALGSTSMAALAHDGPAHWHPEIGAALLVAAVLSAGVFGVRQRLKTGSTDKNQRHS